MGLDTTLTSAPNFDKLEVVATGTFTMPLVLATGVAYTHAHNLGYKPIAFVFMDDGTYSLPLPQITEWDDSGTPIGINNYLYYITDNNNLYINAIVGAGSNILSAEMRYYLCRYQAK